METTSDRAALAQLEQRVHRVLREGVQGNDWVLPAAGTDCDVAIVGGGHSGLAAALTLRRRGIYRVRVFDAADPRETGVWRTVARMNTLLTPKGIEGPELGIDSLSFRAWFEAVHGEAAYRAIDKIATRHWAEYLDWFRKVVDIPVQNRWRLAVVHPHGEHLRLEFETGQGCEFVIARKLVLATGVGGLGGARLPAVCGKLSAGTFAHTAERIDFGRLAGRRVAVIGAAASAFDAAATALEAGAAEVHLFARSRQLNLLVNDGLGTAAHRGLDDNFFALPDELRWKIVLGTRVRTSVPQETVDRVGEAPNFRLHLGAPLQDAEALPGGVALSTPAGRSEFDFVVFGTGYQIDLGRRPELAPIKDAVARWADRPFMSAADRALELAACPYLGAGFELQPRMPGQMPCLRNIHVFSYGAVASFGVHVGQIHSLRNGIPRLGAAISRDLFAAQAQAVLRGLEAQWSMPSPSPRMPAAWRVGDGCALAS